MSVQNDAVDAAADAGNAADGLDTAALQAAVFHSASFASIATDASGIVQIFNLGAERMLGYTADEVVNSMSAAQLADSDELIARAHVLSREVGTRIAPGFDTLVFEATRGIEDVHELTWLRKDGSRFPVCTTVTALRDSQGAIIGYLFIGTDNTEHRQVEDERTKLDKRVRDQQFYTRSLIESNIDALMTTDAHGTITDVNRQTEALTGCTRDELIGAPFKSCFTDADRADAGIHRVLIEGKVTNYELTVCARDGTFTPVSYNATTFHDRDRRLQGVFVSARDVTELKRFEQRLRLTNVELADASRLKSEFLGNVSYELRSPLNAIVGFSEVLKDGLMGELTEQQRTVMADIFSSGTHLLALINDLLDLSKVESGKVSLELDQQDVPSLLRASLSIMREKAALRRVRLSLEVDEDLGSMPLDARKFNQIVHNLLSNAVKFSVEGGQVALRATRVPRATVGRFSGPDGSFPPADSEHAEFLEVSVLDGGVGISPEGLDRLFQPFSRVDGAEERKFEGTGLGLAMVKLLAELHGGAVRVQSTLGAGTVVTVWLPIRAPADDTVAVAPAAARVEVPTGVRTALVVEDDFKSAQLMRLRLESEGFTVVHAGSAEAALVLAVQQPLALITLDIMLPNMDGWEFLDRIKRVPTLMRVPVVIISSVSDANKGFALGAAAVMQKPISRQDLCTSLAEIGLFPVSQGQALRVLVVDDDPKAVELVAIRLRGVASAVFRAYGGREAIYAARKELPDLIVLDLMMPDCNGFDVVEALHAQPDTARIPILVVTAKHITREDRARLEGYVAAIMEKASFDNERFTTEVRRAMSGRRPHL